MTTDLFYSQPVPGKQTFGISRGKTGSYDPVYSTGINSTRKPARAKDGSFLSTLEKVSRKACQTVKDPNYNRTKSAATGSHPVAKKSDDTAFEPSALQNEDVNTRESTPEDSRSDGSDQIPFIRQFMELIKAMESMGLDVLDGGSNAIGFGEGNPADGKDLASLRLMMDRLQQAVPVPSDELKAAFEKLQQFMAEALNDHAATVADGNTGSAGAGDRVEDAARILEWLKRLIAEPVNQKNAAGMAEGQASAADQPSAAALSNAASIVESVGHAIDPTGNAQASGPSLSAEKSGSDLQEIIRGAGNSAKGSPEDQPALNEKPQKTAAGLAVSKTATDLGIVDKSAGRADSAQQTQSDQSHGLQDNMQSTKDRKQAKHPLAAGTILESGNPSAGASKAAAGEEPVSKLLQEAQALKDGEAKVSRGMSEESGGKIIKTEAAANDTVMPNSQSYQTEKPADTPALPKEADTDRNGLKAQTLDQIVQKAAIHLKNGQHEARIDLKPEYLGHIRMQVISENHHVTVKIVAEHGFVKDMIENNAHQLKADLQQQGLNIDKLEVTISRDSDESGQPRERLAGMKHRQDTPDNTDRHGDNGQDLPQERRQWRRPTSGAATVDYFA